MKIQCDVCKGEEASVFCCADEAALCDGCDRRVHRANKLAGKHRRFSLLHPSSSPPPLCDVCQEKRAFLFCQEDRAILCRDCDHPIHSANDLTRKHTRFLLTGIKLSPTATATATASDSPASAAISSSASEKLPEDVNKSSTAAPLAEEANNNNNNTDTAGSGSSISEYLIKELPGWHVEDLLLESSSSSSLSANPTALFGFSKMGEDLMPFLEVDLDGGRSRGGGLATAEGGNNLPMWWVPQMTQIAATNPALPVAPVHHHHHHQGFGLGGELSKVVTRQQQQQTWMGDDCFTVPEITTVQHHRQSSNKRSRPSLWLTSEGG